MSFLSQEFTEQKKKMLLGLAAFIVMYRGTDQFQSVQEELVQLDSLDCQTNCLHFLSRF